MKANTILEKKYKATYTTASARMLFLIAKKSYGSLTKMAQALGIRRQYFNQFFTDGIPYNYAGMIAEKTCFDPSLLVHELHVTLYRENAYSFLELLKEASCYFTPQDMRYIIGGTFIRSNKTFLSVKKDAASKS